MKMQTEVPDYTAKHLMQYSLRDFDGYICFFDQSCVRLVDDPMSYVLNCRHFFPEYLS